MFPRPLGRGPIEARRSSACHANSSSIPRPRRRGPIEAPPAPSAVRAGRAFPRPHGRGPIEALTRSRSATRHETSPRLLGRGPIAGGIRSRHDGRAGDADDVIPRAHRPRRETSLSKRVVSPLRGSIVTRPVTHGLRRGLRFFRACGAFRDRAATDLSRYRILAMRAVVGRAGDRWTVREACSPPLAVL